MPNVTCCVQGYHNKSKHAGISETKIKFFSFPSNSTFTPWKKKQRQQWLAEIIKNTACEKNWQPSANSRICSAHFFGNGRSKHPQHPSYLPRIFPMKNNKRKFEQSMERFQRSLKRCKRHDILPSTKFADIADRPVSPAENLMNEVVTTGLDKFAEVGCQTEGFDNHENDSETYHFCYQIIRGNLSDTSFQVNICRPSKKTTKNKATSADIPILKLSIDVSTQCVGFESLEPSGFHGIASIKNERAMSSVAGVSSRVFNYLVENMPQFKESKLTKKDQVLLCLMKIKLGLSSSALACLFNIHPTTGHRIFFLVLQCLRILLSNVISWPSQEIVRATLPEAFKEKYPNTRVIIDCTEIRTEVPSNVTQQVLMFSNYKHGQTVKFLVGCTPNGFISFLSDCYGGRTGDCFITVDSGLLDLLEPGDQVLPDKGFPNIKTDLQDKNAILVMPPFANKPQFTPDEVQETYNIVSVRIHIERIMQRIKDAHILRKISIRLLPYIDDIVFVTCALVNVQNPIIKEPEKA